LSAVLHHDREFWRVSPIQSVYGGTTEIMKEIVSRDLGLQSDQAFYETRAPGS
jgi:hypothetical protein